MNDRILFRVDDLARALAISRTTIWRWTRDGRLPPPVYVGTIPFWPAEQVRRHVGALAMEAAVRQRRSRRSEPQ